VAEELLVPTVEAALQGARDLIAKYYTDIVLASIAGEGGGEVSFSADTAIGELFVIVGSSGYLEIAANQASAADKVGCGAGSPVELELFYDS